MIRKISIATLACLAILGSVQAQENKTIKEETTTKRVVSKEGSNVNVQVVEDVDTVKGAVVVEGTNETNQEFKETSTKMSDAKLVENNTVTNNANKSMVMEAQMKQETALQKSIMEAKAEAEKQRMMLAEKEAQRQAELAARRAQLEARPKGMSKLKKDN